MKNILHSLVLSMAVGMVCWEFAGCKHTPPPPTEQDAMGVWKNISQKPRLRDLVSLKKTNGQMEEVNGTYVYTLYYQATVKDLVQLGNRAPGTVETYSGNFPFQWTEEGWMGPDHQVYTQH